MKITKIYTMFLLCLLLSGTAALSQEAPISDNTVNTSGGQGYQTPAPSAFSLSQNFHEPFTIIYFNIEKQENVKLMVVNEFGREVITIVNKNFNPGKYEIKLDASDLGSGEYFWQISTPSFSETKRMLLNK